MEAKFSQYQKISPLTFCIVATLDPRLKLVGIETLIIDTNKNMSQINVNDMCTIRTQLELLT